MRGPLLQSSLAQALAALHLLDLENRQGSADLFAIATDDSENLIGGRSGIGWDTGALTLILLGLHVKDPFVDLNP